MSNAPAGWYPDPENPGQQRYWNGAAWTQDFAPTASIPSQPVAPAQAAAPTPAGQQVGKKPVYQRTWFIVLAVLIGLAIVGNMLGGNDSEPSSVAQNEPAASTPAEPSVEPAAEEPAAAEPEPEPEPKWVKVTSLSGKGNKRSKTFEIGSGEVELKYSVKGGESLICGIYVVPEGQNLQKEGGFPEVMVSEAGKDSTMLVKDPGTYYLDVTSANCDWTLTILEKR
ncbi:MAG: DUF2510 domain-containing protein [Coriobacteriia bacterium]|nr:DUF2510 domain-containing protein [Coriobacteriia bacterium]